MSAILKKGINEELKYMQKEQNQIQLLHSDDGERQL
jgi:hypothetical protein